MKLVIVDFPPGHAIARGDNYFFTLTFRLPRVVERLELKALFAGRVEIGPTTYYPALAPCEPDFASVPAMAIGASASPAAINLGALRNVHGCSGVAYRMPNLTPPGAVEVVEFYDAALDHSFVSWLPSENAALDAGVSIRGWQRTGYTFNAWPSPQAGTSPVCRFYIPLASGDSHFYGRGAAECEATAPNLPAFTLEATEFMHLTLPVDGACPAGMHAVHGVFSNRATRDHMATTRGWLAEGDGPDRVVMCSP